MRITLGRGNTRQTMLVPCKEIRERKGNEQDNEWLKNGLLNGFKDG